MKVARAAVKGRRSATRPEVFVRFQREFDDFKPDSLVEVGIRSQFGAGLSSFSGIAEAQAAVSSAIALRRSEELAIRESVRSDLATLQSFCPSAACLGRGRADRKARFTSLTSANFSPAARVGLM